MWNDPAKMSQPYQSCKYLQMVPVQADTNGHDSPVGGVNDHDKTWSALI